MKLYFSPLSHLRSRIVFVAEVTLQELLKD